MELTLHQHQRMSISHRRSIEMESPNMFMYENEIVIIPCPTKLLMILISIILYIIIIFQLFLYNLDYQQHLFTIKYSCNSFSVYEIWCKSTNNSTYEINPMFWLITFIC